LTLLAEREQEVTRVGLVEKAGVVEKVTMVPGVPVFGVKVSVMAAYAGFGIRIAGTEKIRADASRSIRHMELTRRVINSKHARRISRVLTI
jgi:hypothetical protein